MLTKQQIREDLHQLVYEIPQAIAAWEGGSAATGFVDDYSDMDLIIVCEDESVELIFEKLENYFESRCGIERKHRVPEPAWHGFSQCFYKIGNVPELFYMDIGVIKKSIPDKLTESDRHGFAAIWFEKEPTIDSTPCPQEKRDARCKQFYATAVQTDFLMCLEIKKNLSRQRYSEAFPFYYQFVSRQLGIMLNLKYRPEKVDFGLRYASRDYAIEDATLIEQLLQCDSLPVLSSNFESALSRYESLKAELAPLWA